MCHYPLAAFVIVNPVVNLFNVQPATTEQINKTLPQRCNNVWYYSFSILKKHICNNWIFFCMICLIYNYFSRLRIRVIYIATRKYLVKRCCNVCPKQVQWNFPTMLWKRCVLAGYMLDEWFWTMFELTPIWPNYTFGGLFMCIGVNDDQIWLPWGHASDFEQISKRPQLDILVI